MIGNTNANSGTGRPDKLLEKLLEVDGPGSGLDADTLDGKHAAGLANADLSNVPDEAFKVKIDASGTTEALGKKADKAAGATEGNFAGLDGNGNLTDSGKKAGDFAPAGDYATNGELAEGLAGKVDVVAGKGLSTEDYTTAEKTKLAGIEAGATKYQHPETHPAGMITGLGDAATKNVGTTAETVAAGDHTHTGMYQPVGNYAVTDLANVTDVAFKSKADAAGVGGGEIEDAFLWVQGTLPASVRWCSVAYSQGVFVALANSAAAYSSDDGKTWTQSILPTSTMWQSVAAYNGIFVAVTNGAALSAYSTDGGKTWTQSTLPISANWGMVAATNGIFVTIANNSDDAAYSTDGGKTWTRSALPVSANWVSVAATADMFMAVTSGSNIAAYSVDGKTWVQSDLPVSGDWYALTGYDGVFVSIAFNTSTAVYTTKVNAASAVTWMQTTLPVSGNWNSIAVTNGVFLTAGFNSNKAVYSTDFGKTWNQKVLPLSSTWYAIASGNGVFVAVTQGSSVTGSTVSLCGRLIHLIGDTAIALEKHNHNALGVGTVAVTEEQLVVGKYNTTNPDALFVVGNGTSDAARLNAVEITPSEIKLREQGIYGDRGFRLAHYDGYGENKSGVTIGAFNYNNEGVFWLGKYGYSGDISLVNGDIYPIASYDNTTKIMTLAQDCYIGVEGKTSKAIATRKNTSMPIRINFTPINVTDYKTRQVKLVEPIYGSIYSVSDWEYLCTCYDADHPYTGIAVGLNNICDADGYAFGKRLIASNYQLVLGQWNRQVDGFTTPTGSGYASSGLVVIGNGKRTGRANVYRIDSAGSTYAGGSYHTSGADYAEMFEWWDGNPDNEDRRGRFVALHEGKLRFWGEFPSSLSRVPEKDSVVDDTFENILGVVSATPAILGDSYEDQWQGMYQTDIFGEVLFEEYTDPAFTDEEGVFHKEEKRMVPKTKPEYNPDKPYVPRSQRKEWAAVGMMGKLVVIDDGTCIVGGRCVPKGCGIGTASAAPVGYHVLERLDTSHIRILIK